MKLLTTILTAILTVAPIAEARIGETMAQATARLGPSTSQKNERSHTVKTWDARTDRPLCALFFREGRVFQEILGPITQETVTKHLQNIVPGTWQTVEIDPSPIYKQGQYFTNGKHTAWRKDSALIAVAEPLRSAEQTDAERQASFDRYSIDRQLASKAEAKQNERGVFTIVSAVVSRFRGGLLVKAPEDSGLSEHVLITGHPGEPYLVDGNAIAIRARLSDTPFQYTSAFGGIRTIHQLSYLGDYSSKK